MPAVGACPIASCRRKGSCLIPLPSRKGHPIRVALVAASICDGLLIRIDAIEVSFSVRIQDIIVNE